MKKYKVDVNGEKMIKKNDEYIVDIIDNGFEGEGIAKIDNFTIFIHGAIKGEKVKIHIVKVNSSYAFGKVIQIIEKSNSRIKEDCTTYKRCGGCNLRHIEYNQTLLMKQSMIQNLVDKMLAKKVIVEETKGMDDPFYYRNKAQYPLGYDKDNNPVIGIFANRTHEIIPMKNCLIQNQLSEKIAKYIYEFAIDNKIQIYNEKTQKGILRHIVIKIGVKTNEIMCILVMNGKELPKKKDLIEKLVKEFPNIKTIMININRKNTNVILGNQSIILYGDGYIYDMLDEYKFKISPMSFYQTNPIQTEVLYKLAIEKAKLDKNDIVFDLYCGIGTIAIYIAKNVKKVYGIEIVEQAIEDANENAKINHIENIEFYNGDVENTLIELIDNKNIIPNVIFVDPPRKGLDNKTIENILKMKPNKVLYISCNPSTLMRDLSKLEEKYEVMNIAPVDMFPYTHHIECVCSLELR